MSATTQSVNESTRNRRQPNEREAETALRAAIDAHGPDSAPADCARRHLRLICRFNQRNAWRLH